MTGERRVFSYADAAAAAGLDAGALKRLQRRDLLSSPAERAGRPENDGLSLAELVRAAAYRHFENCNARPNQRTRGWLLQQTFDGGPFLVVMRQTKQAIVIDVDRLGAVAAEPGAYAVYDPAPLLRRLGLS